jgi:two-component SAPR family response regulator
MKALFISGYTADIIERKGILEKGLDFIYKPISPDDLTKKLKELIGK